MKKVKLYEDLKLLTSHVYGVKNNLLPKDWKILNVIIHESSGFQGAVYQYKTKKNNIIAVVYAGLKLPENFLNLSEDEIYENDFWIDFGKFLKNIMTQFTQADKLYNWAREFFPKAHIVVTGHSLGGSLAQLVSAYSGVKGVTFNPFGVGAILESDGFNQLQKINVENFGDLSDFLFKMELEKQPGITYILHDNTHSKKISDVIFNSSNINIYLKKQMAKDKENNIKNLYHKSMFAVEKISQKCVQFIINCASKVISITTKKKRSNEKWKK